MAQFESAQAKGLDKMNKRKQAAKEKKQQQLVDAFNIAAAESNFANRADIKRVAEIMNVSERTVRNYLKEIPLYKVELGELVDRVEG